MRSKMANCGGLGFGGSGGGFSGGFGGGLPNNTAYSSGGNFYSPELSTDFLELPQSLDEARNFYRFFYDHEPFVGRAVDLHTEIPLSKVRIGMPKVHQEKSRKLAKAALRFCEEWSDRINLLQRLISICHEYHLIGEAFIFVEDTSPDMPREIREKLTRVKNEETGFAEERWEEYEDADERAFRW
ncbi:MAG: hypothetical protein AAGM67_00920, partial [Bacteroidota bacterium]